MEKAKLRDGSFRASLLKYAKENHGTRPDYPWEKYPGNAVLRHLDSNK